MKKRVEIKQAAPTGVEKKEVIPVTKANLEAELRSWKQQGDMWLRAAQENGQQPYLEGLAEGGNRILQRLAERFGVSLED